MDKNTVYSALKYMLKLMDKNTVSYFYAKNVFIWTFDQLLEISKMIYQ